MQPRMRLISKKYFRRKKCEKTLTNQIPLPVVFLCELLGRSPDS